MNHYLAPDEPPLNKKCKRKDCRCSGHPENCCDPGAVAPKEGKKK